MIEIIRRFKQKLDPLVVILLKTRGGRVIANSIVAVGRWLSFNQDKLFLKASEQKLKNLFQDLTVASGFFQGLRYPSFESVGSSLFPKILGSYESELNDTLISLEANNYKTILDIGSAEGFYAVGLARKFAEASVYAFDINQHALESCLKMARLNRVDHRLILGTACTADTLRNFSFCGKTLIVCDCEGFENELFTPDTGGVLYGADMIIELHPFVVKDVKENLFALFSETHNIQIVSSHSSSRKAFDFQHLLCALSPKEQLRAVEEGRPFTMEWLVAKAKFSYP